MRGTILLAAIAALATTTLAALPAAPVAPAAPAAGSTVRAETLPPRQLAGQRIVCAYGGAAPPASLVRRVRRGHLAGVILFAHNLRSRARARRAARRLQRVARASGLGPLLVMTDQEGGEVKRLRGAPGLSAAQMGRRGPRAARRQGRRTARNLRSAGVNVNLAPVLDVARRGGFIARQRRSFGRSPARVGRVGVAFARGLRAGGVAATAKHFPGLGSTPHNTDLRRSFIRLRAGTLRRIDMAPFRAFAAARGDLVMVGSAVYPALGRRPAALSPAIVRGELRRRLGFRGVTITDAIETPALRPAGGTSAVGVKAVRAGIDLLLFTRGCGRAGRATTALRRAIAAGRLPRPAAEAAAQRVLDLRASMRR